MNELDSLKEVIESSMLEKLETSEQFEETEACITRDINEYSEYFHKTIIFHLTSNSNISSCKEVPIFDYDIVKNSVAFMLGPVCLYDKKAYGVELHSFKTLNDCKVFLQGKNYITYYTYAKIKTHEWVGGYDGIELSLKPLEDAEIGYIFRGIILE